MRQKKLTLILAFLVCFALTLPAEIIQAQIVTDNSIGNHDGYDYEFWKDSGGSGTMILNHGGTFSAQWNNVNNILFRKGKKFNETQTHQQVGNMSINYGANFQPNGNAYLCVYGWTVDPLVEYYIVDSWGNWRPPGATPKGTITVDGGTYDIYETLRVNQPSIKGIATFKQYWSVRRSKRTSGTISVSNHFRAWENLGMNMGKMYEVALTVEGYQSSGSANVYSNTLRINGNPLSTISNDESITLDKNN
ncbi:glycoside hydrolase family 11 protein [Salipaludibacillus agaradhaerens]|jgi:endo-1,4-beta-xylanase|uniref:Endo-1,4-beta-xylanase n=1 Tax=Salipaludibacillus agaradhaerens TaxID=76935 RepID=A0A9E8C305_SALAG|nr:glycoside hydrolase family 11 protein [Salipaludibacillus agaradhaerens]MCR6097164.1 glycoside hydrolase family 11 protein [Salipaludibacillus agaradhaerens]MCR6105999.1 glycoside hydrolase family 11 protein [Salipaludibacillus agaradhaerens]MCR6113351.1 glycoside hydrolase family 11 protein [Salipaludibacillus agaradhaerens]MCR6118032.1 glycoside hydrolase family 11 protein [Salipaludibacillus agaradhaerens]UZE89496.1 xylanase GH11 [Salipaludibacillus agaradhaerens]